MKRVISLLLVLVMLLSAVPFVSAASALTADPGTTVWEGTYVDLLLDGNTTNEKWSTNQLNVNAITVAPTADTTYSVEYTMDGSSTKQNASITINVLQKARPYFTINETTAIVGEELTLTTTGAGDSAITWSGEGVDANGKFKVDSAGTYDVTATAENDPADPSDNVAVTERITASVATYKVTVVNKTISLNDKNTYVTYTAKKGSETVTPSSVTYTVTGNAITVSTTGLITPKAEGTATVKVTATFADGATASGTGTITVTAPKCDHERVRVSFATIDDITHTVDIICTSCEKSLFTGTEECLDKDRDYLCDRCGQKLICIHGTADIRYVSIGNGTHQIIATCTKCEGIVFTNIVLCTDTNDDDRCDICDGKSYKTEDEKESVDECLHTSVPSEEYRSNGDNTHTKTECCSCGVIVSRETAECSDFDLDNKCDACGDVFFLIERFSMVGSNMTLGNELEINFLFNKSDLSAEDCTATVTQYRADGTTTFTELVQDNWSTIGTYHKVSVRIAAKEMADQLSIEIRDAEGNVLNETYSTSVRDYAGRALAASSTTIEVKTMMVDMVNYGAAAQQHFSYSTDDLANNALTAAQQALASAKVFCTNDQVKGKNCYGANLSLEDRIEMNVFFSGLKNKDVASMYAMVTFEDYKGKAYEVRVEGSEFIKMTTDLYGVVVDDIVLADAKQMVTITVYNADGSEFGSAADSVASYVARAEASGTDTYGLYANIMKFAASAYNYFMK